MTQIASASARIISIPLDPPIVTPNYDIPTIESVFLRLRSSDGVEGYSYLWCFGRAQADLLVAGLRFLAPILVGESWTPDIFNARARRHINFLGYKGVTVFALSACDLALHDVLLKSRSQNLAEFRAVEPTSVPAYWSGFFLNSPISELREEAVRAGEAGFRAMKLRVGGSDLREDLRRIEAVIESAPRGTEIMLDAVQAWATPAEAIHAAKAYADYDPRWLEDPLHHADYAGLAEVARQSPIPIASGENEYLREGFEQQIASGVSVLLADFERVGGLVEWDAVARRAGEANVSLTPHLYPHLSVQLGATRPVGVPAWVEYVPWWDEILEAGFQIAQGRVTASTAPGIGLTPHSGILDRDALTPWIELHAP